MSKDTREAREIALEDLVCASVLNAVREVSPARVASVSFGSTSRPVEVTAIDRVVYVPHLCLQIWRDNIVPQEANPDYNPIGEIHDEIRESGARMAPTVIDEINHPVCILGNRYSGGFYHFFEELFKVTVLEEYHFHGSYVILPKYRFMKEILNLLHIPDDRIIQCSNPTLFRSVYFTTPIRPEDVYVYSGVFFALRDRLRAAVGDRGGGARLWLHRRGARTVVNAAEVERLLDRFGFQVIDTAELSICDQITAAKHASILAGPHGAGFIHAMFMPERSAVIECFSPEYINPSIIQICRTLRHRYFPIVGTNTSFLPYAHGVDVDVRCDQLELILENLASN